MVVKGRDVLSSAFRCALVVLVLGASLSVLGRVFGEPWPTERRGPARSASVNTGEPVFPLTLDWKAQLEGPLTSSAVVRDDWGSLYIGSDAGKLWALDLDTGAIGWTFEASGEVQRPALAIELGGNRRVYLTTSAGTLHALDAATGAEVWHVDGGGPFISSPAYVDGKILYIHEPSLSQLRAVDASSGAISWETSDFNYTVRPPVISGDVAYLSRASGGLCFSVVDVATGVRNDNLLWGLTGNGVCGAGVVDLDRPLRGDDCSIVGDRFYLSRAIGTVTALDIRAGEMQATAAWDASLPTASEVWGLALSRGRGNDNVLIAAQLGALHALDPRTGEIRWGIEHDRNLIGSRRQTPKPAIWGSYVFQAAKDSVLALSVSDGAVKWSFGLDAMTVSSPVVSGTALYMADRDGAVYALSSAPATEGDAEPPRRTILWLSSAPSEVKRYDADSGVHLDDFVSDGDSIRPVDFIFGPDGNLYVSCFDRDEVRRYDGGSGDFIDVFVTAGSGGLDGPEGVRFGPDGNLYVASLWTHQIKRYDGSSGAFIDDFASGNGLTRPTWIFFWNDLYVSSSITNEVKRFDEDTGAFIGNFVSAGSGGLDHPMGLVFQPDGYLYVASRETNEVKRYDGSTGAFVDDFISSGSGGLVAPVDLQVYDDFLYVTSYGTDSVKRYRADSGAYDRDFVEACVGGLRKPMGLRIRIDTSSGSPGGGDAGSPGTPSGPFPWCSNIALRWCWVITIAVAVLILVPVAFVSVLILRRRRIPKRARPDGAGES